MLQYWATLLFTVLLSVTTARAEVSFPVEWQGRQIQIGARFLKPPGPGPFPLVILLQHCGGRDAYDANMLPIYASLLTGQGYATLQPDSFVPRGYPNGVCGTFDVKPRDAAHDAFDLATFMMDDPEIRRDRIGVIGLSHGAHAAAQIARDFDYERPWRAQLAAKGGKFVASVAMYGEACGNPDNSPVILPSLLLLGGRDSTTRPELCAALARTPGNGMLQVQVYPDAFHAFDAPSNSGVDHARSVSGGWVIGYDAAAAQDARARLVAFFREHLQ